MKAIWKCITSWIHQHLHLVTLSVLTSTVIIIFTYVMGNSGYPLPGETGALKQITDYKKFLGIQIGQIPDSVLMINVCYDKMLVPYTENEVPVGNTIITDRGKLLEFLTKAKAANNYRYIFMDVFFEEGMETEYDSALFSTILSMDRLVIPKHKGAVMCDSNLYRKASNADYATTWQALSFSRYQYIHDDDESVALKIYQDRCGSTIKRHWGGLWYTDNGRLCQNSATLLLPIRVTGSLLDEEGQARERNYIYLSADMLDLDEMGVMSVSEQIDDKLVIIGDFKSDVHSTFLGPQPGSSILFNGYIALTQGAHLVNWTYMAILFVIYIIIGLFYLSGHSFSSMVMNPWLSIVLSFASTATVFLIIALVASWFDLAFNMWVPTTVYSLYDTFMQKYNIYKNKKK
ncbi:hypothetical protein [Prevotella sp. P6B4]|uniref:hypothetical protein n=1 Tax=Prevotella sp. P6B4 TaxID=1410614 RepID=UPI00048EBB18|nr:hypothetical protein [Prevotella sp. P6B4]